MNMFLLLVVLMVDNPSSAKIETPRSSVTTKFGSGTLERRTDGSIVRTQKFGSGQIIRDGKTTGVKHGNITRWSNGTTTQERKFGGQKTTTHTYKDGSRVTGVTRNQGSTSRTQRSNGSFTTSNQIGNVIRSKDKP